MSREHQSLEPSDDDSGRRTNQHEVHPADPVGPLARSRNPGTEAYAPVPLG